jgi:glycosyltransferase involved in cell wall biosynthesis
LALDSLVLTNSELLRRRYEGCAQRVVATRTTTLSKGDIFRYNHAFAGSTIRVLFSGRLDFSKGIEEIANAVIMLGNMGIEIELGVVGWEDKGRCVQERLQGMFSEANSSARLCFYGRKRAGAELLHYYRNSDVFVVASRRAEGFPRTIWEAMASSTPVISTAVGSIPYFLKDGESALLVPPNDPQAIGNAILRLREDQQLRDRLVTNGLRLAAENTVDKCGAEIVSAISEWLRRASS